MADCNLTIELATGADTPVTAGYILIRRVAEGRKGQRLALADFKQYDFTDEPLVVTLEQGQVMESIEMRPRGKTRIWQVPAATAFNYVDLEWLEEDPPGSGTFVLEAKYENYDGATGEPDIAVGDRWYASNPLHPSYGYLMRKDS